MTEPDPTQQPVVELADVCKSFGDFRVLSHMDLRVYRGETLVIIGRSGTGKSVSLRHIVGLLSPDSGRILVFGKDLQGCTEGDLKEVRRRIGYLFQDGALLNWLTIAQNVALPLEEVYRLPRSEVQERVEVALATVELQEAGDRYPSEVSGGMRKRAGLARALVCRPEVILYDEPTSGLDPISSNIINHLVNNLKAKLGVTQVVVTHDMSSAFMIGDRIALLHDGRILAEGSPDQLQESDDPAILQFIHGRIEGPLALARESPQAARTREKS